MLTPHTLHIVAVGKHRDRFLCEGIDHYSRNIRKFCRIRWHVVREGKIASPRACIEAEAGSIRSALDSIPGGFVVACRENRNTPDSRALSENFRKWMDRSLELVFVLGGAYGLSREILEKSDATLSLSPLTFNHLLVRLVLSEQLYRALSLVYGTGYHH